MEPTTISPIGVFRSDVVHPYEAARQPRPDDARVGEIHLFEGSNFEQALLGLADFERIWVIFQFHHNQNWKPMVRPPRGDAQKKGVFATRAPYRPNFLGISCLRLRSIEGRVLTVIGADLLDGSPIFDLKPYVPEADAFPDARVGWLENVKQRAFEIEWSRDSSTKIDYLYARGVHQLKDFLTQQLEYEPYDEDRKRISKTDRGFIIAYRTWRALFQEVAPGKIQVLNIFSGYSETDLQNPTDKWQDKPLHRQFQETFG